MSTSDIYPTLAHMLYGTETQSLPDQPKDGTDIMPLIEGKQKKRNALMAFSVNGAAVVGDRYK